MLWILFGIGFVLVFEGLVLALAPHLYEQVVEFLAEVSVEQRRTIGLIAAGFGVLALWAATSLGVPSQ